ncbi:restriction endonuclease subunit S [Streptococcus australis]|uniref:restriction endonuclease subunit S n=1 Tax=Streptococcus australis TaxID=113107 RepID=UPI001CBC58D4|nr:restriction endonuclease subunit S [Streptococcus australis]MBZ2159211.1 restriction endonuclease subunit S [Streptococcus australis]
MIKVNKPKIRFNKFENIWTKSKLGELYEIYSGNTPSRSDNRNYQNGEIPWIKTTDLNNSIICSNEEKISVYGAIKLKVLPEKSVLIAMYGGFNQIGRTGLLAYPATINQALAALTPVNEINPNFLLNFLNFKKESWRNVAASSRKDPNITKNDVEKFKISFPSLDEQSAIGSLFCTLDDLLASYKDNLANYQSLKATMLAKMFPKVGHTVPEIRLDGFEGEWEKVKLKDVTESIEYGLNASAKEFDGENKYIRITDIDDVSRKFKEDSITSPDINVSECDNYLLCEKDILFARTGASVGKTYLYDIKDGKVYFAGFLIRARIKERFDSKFIFQNTLSDRFTRYVKVTSQRSGQPGVNGKEYGEYELYFPKDEEQRAIGSYFSNLDNLINSHQEKISQLETLKKKLLQDMFI